MENGQCLRCRGAIVEGQEQVTIFLFSQTVGIRPRQKSRAYRVQFCTTCAVSTAMGPSPETALNIAAWTSLRDLIGDNSRVTQTAWDRLNAAVRPALIEGEVLLELENTEPIPFGTSARAS